MDGFMTPGEAAVALGITDRAVRKRIAHRQLHAERAGGKVWLIPIGEVERAKAEPLRAGRRGGDEAS